jgi:hypothetical protein
MYHHYTSAGRFLLLSAALLFVAACSSEPKVNEVR